MDKGKVTKDGLIFGPNGTGKRYLCGKWHRGAGSSQHKTIWFISELEEYLLFCTSDDNGWKDIPGNYWAVKEGGAVLGYNDERVAKFPVPRNENDIWHGYPVMSGEDRPPFSLIELWYEYKLIGAALRKRLKKGKV